RVEDSAEERAEPGDAAADERVAAPGELAGVRQTFGESHADAGADRGCQSGEERVVRLVSGQRGGEDRGERGERAVDEADHGRLHTLQEKGVFVRHRYIVYRILCKLPEHKASLTRTVRRP